MTDAQYNEATLLREQIKELEAFYEVCSKRQLGVCEHEAKFVKRSSCKTSKTIAAPHRLQAELQLITRQLISELKEKLHNL